MKPADFSRSKVTEVSSYTCYTLQIILNNRACVCVCAFKERSHRVSAARTTAAASPSLGKTFS